MKTSIITLFVLSFQTAHSAFLFVSTNTNPHDFTVGNGLETLTVDPSGGIGAGYELRVTSDRTTDTNPDFLVTKYRGTTNEDGFASSADPVGADRWVEYHLGSALTAGDTITLSFEFYHIATNTQQALYSGDGRDDFEGGPHVIGNGSTTVLPGDPDSRRIDPVTGEIIYRRNNVNSGNIVTYSGSPGSPKEAKIQLYTRFDNTPGDLTDRHVNSGLGAVDFNIISTSTLFDNGSNTLQSMIASGAWDDGTTNFGADTPGPYYSSPYGASGNTVTINSGIGATDQETQIRASLFHDTERFNHEAAVLSTTMTISVNSGQIDAGTVFQFTLDGNLPFIAPVPEPSAIALLALGIVPILLRRKRK